MQEFKIETDAARKRHEIRIRFVAWGTVVLLFFVAVLIFVLGVNGILGPGRHPLVAFLFVSTPILAMVGGGILGCWEALRCAERQMVFILNRDGIVRKRRGFPDIAIRFSEMQYVGEELRWLVIKSAEPLRKIGIPNDVSGYEVIRAELAKHHPLDVRSGPRSKSVGSVAASSLCLIATIVSWSLFVWSHDRKIVVTAGIFAVISVAWGCVRFWKLLNKVTVR